jgi:hypothetical protein
MDNDEEVIKQRYDAVAQMRSICFSCFKEDFLALKKKKAEEAASGIVNTPQPRGRSGTLSFVCDGLVFLFFFLFLFFSCSPPFRSEFFSQIAVRPNEALERSCARPAVKVNIATC